MHDMTKKMIEKIENFSNREDACNYILKEICKIYDWPYGEVWLMNRSHEQLVFGTAWYSGEHFEKFAKFSSICKFAKGVGFIGSVWQSSSAVHLTDLKKLAFLRYDISDKTGFSAGTGIPLIMDNEAAAVFAFFVFKQNDLSEEVIKNIEEIINRIAPALNENFNWKN